jgi:hypothetical protein
MIEFNSIDEWDLLTMDSFLDYLWNTYSYDIMNYNVRWNLFDVKNWKTVDFSEIYINWEYENNWLKYKTDNTFELILNLLNGNLSSFFEPIYWELIIIIDDSSVSKTFLVTENWVTCVYSINY